MDAKRLWKRSSEALAVATRRWMTSRTSLLAAALAFHALLTLAPILLLLLAAAGRLLGHEETRDSLAEAAVRFAGPGADRVASTLLNLVAESRGRATGTLLGIVLLLYFASSFFVQLRAALDAVWGARPRGFRRALLDYVFSLAETLGALTAGLLVLAAGVLRSTIRPLLAQPGAAGTMAWMAWTRLGTLLMTCAVLGITLRYIPSVRPRPSWGAVLAGALPCALILNLASEAFAFIIGRSALASLYGAAGSIIMFLLWVHYSAWIVLFGAELCRSWEEAAGADLRA